ncbi:hypothetical protein AgCh_002591 [Apium graveolens]
MLWDHATKVNKYSNQDSDECAHMAMRKAKEKIMGNHDQEFKKLYSYENELMKVMPDTTVKLMTEVAEAGVEGRRFKRFYVCLGPLKAGFLSGYRPLIGLDECHLKGPFKKILLSVVATDPNDGMYHVAWAQGLVNALEKYFPAAEKRAMKVATRATPVWNGGDKFYMTMNARGHEMVVDLKRIALERPKKNRKKNNDMIVEARQNNPTMLKRKQTSLRCGTFKCLMFFWKLDPEWELEEGYGAEEVEPVKKIVRFFYCKEEGHNTRTCKSKKVDLEIKKRDARLKHQQQNEIMKAGLEESLKKKSEEELKLKKKRQRKRERPRD